MIDRILKDFAEFKKISIEDINILKSPQDFYSFILEKTKTARVVYLACLVFGAGEHAKKILDVLGERVCLRMKTLVFVDKMRIIKNL